MSLTKRRTALSAASLFSGKLPAAPFQSAISADLVHRLLSVAVTPVTVPKPIQMFISLKSFPFCLTTCDT
jgi:hypothetical protein